jgi:hypothetical protein
LGRTGRAGACRIEVKRQSVACLLAMAALGGAATPATADSLSLSATPSPVVTGQSLTINFSGTKALGEGETFLQVAVAPVPATCAPSSSTEFLGRVTNLAVRAPTENETTFSLSDAVPVELAPSFEQLYASSLIAASAGEYRLCAYLEGGVPATAGQTYATASTVFTVRLPRDSLTLAPSYTAPVGPFNLPIGISVEPGTTPVSVEVIFYPKGNVEGHTYSCEAPLERSYLEPAPGASSVNYATYLYGPASYGLCVALLNARPRADVVLASTSTSISVSGHGSGPHYGPVKCVVPRVAGKTLALARRALSVAHCRTGRTTWRKRHGKKHGTVLAQGTRPGTRLPAGTKINLIVAS